MLTREQLLAAVPKPRPVFLPELKESVFIRPLSGMERDAFEIAQFERRQAGKPANHRGALVARCLVREDGTRLFTDSDEDADAVGAVASPLVDRLFEAAQRASGFTEQDVKVLGEGSSASPGGASPSDSHAN
ncbi:MAG: hypothetical protein KBA95_01865 [Acidobacteria bacterium]|nr:hypothetical protein [Acidobacteriota bacterium]